MRAERSGHLCDGVRSFVTWESWRGGGACKERAGPVHQTWEVWLGTAESDSLLAGARLLQLSAPGPTGSKTDYVFGVGRGAWIPVYSTYQYTEIGVGRHTERSHEQKQQQWSRTVTLLWWFRVKAC